MKPGDQQNYSAFLDLIWLSVNHRYKGRGILFLGLKSYLFTAE